MSSTFKRLLTINNPFFLILLIAAIAGFTYYIKKKKEREIREFARQHDLNYDSASAKGFKSAKMDESSFKKSTSSSYSTQRENHDDMSMNYKSSLSYSYRHDLLPVDRGAVHHTTVINDGSNNNDSLTGMMINEMMHDHHDNHVYNEPVSHVESTPSYTSNDSSNDDDNKVSSGSWGLSSRNSDWGSSSDSGSSDSGSSDW